MGVNEVEDDVECASEDKREEECETCQIRISLSTTSLIKIVSKMEGTENALELSRCNVSLGSDVTKRPLLSRFRELRLGADFEHALQSICEEYTHETICSGVSIWVGDTCCGNEHKRYFERVCDLGNYRGLREESKNLFPHCIWKRRHEKAESGHLMFKKIRVVERVM